MSETVKMAQSQTVSNLHLANAWFSKGKFALASTYFQRVLALDPTCAEAYLGLGRIALSANDKAQALAYFEQALTVTPESYRAKVFRAVAQDTWTKLDENPQLPTHSANPRMADSPTFPQKISLGGDIIIDYHRSGWKYALKALHPLHNPSGILFDGFLEHTFSRRDQIEPRSAKQLTKMRQQGIYEFFATPEEKGIIPYQEPWVGFVHNPPRMPPDIDFYAQNSLQNMAAHPLWIQSFEHCVGLFTLSEYSARWLRQETGRPVSALTFPTEIPDIQFDMARFRQNQAKKIIQIGWWLRRINAIYELPLARGNPLNYRKACLMPGGNQEVLKSLLAAERKLTKAPIAASFMDNTEELPFLPNDAYDKLLSENLVFVELYDSSANNAIVECIARATPILVNPLPPVIEYLGVDYPFYFESLSEAADKALDLDLIEETHNYLQQCSTRAKFDSHYFLESFTNSEVYQLV